MEKDEVQQSDKKIAEELNTFLKNIVSTLDIDKSSSIINQNFQNVDDSVDTAIEMHKYHPSIILINDKADNQNNFSFESVALSDVVKEIKRIDPNKSDSVLPKIPKISSEATANILQKLLNKSIESGTSLDTLKLTDITLLFKKKDPLNKTNYRPVNVLTIASKLF